MKLNYEHIRIHADICIIIIIIKERKNNVERAQLLCIYKYISVLRILASQIDAYIFVTLFIISQAHYETFRRDETRQARTGSIRISE